MSEPRILLWDIESSPLLARVWQRYQADALSIESDWYILSIAWKWLGDKRTNVIGLCDFERYATNPENDYELVKKAHELFCEADIVVAHNGIAFDTKKAQARMIIHGFEPPTPFKEVDTLRVARGHFAFTSNRLGDVCTALGIGGKAETGGFQTWLGCINGDPKAWAKMKKYNKHDVVILEQLYLKLRPWMSRHPNLATIAEVEKACPKCGSTEGMKPRGWSASSVSRRRVYQCVSCSGYSSGRVIERSEAQYV